MKGEKAIQPLLDYLEKYPLKYQSKTYNWYKECFNLRKYVKKNRSDATAKQQLEMLLVIKFRMQILLDDHLYYILDF